MQSYQPTGSQICGEETRLFENMCSDLEARGFTIQPGALPGPVTDCLTSLLQQIDADGFHQAQIGRNGGAMKNRFVRRNKICWIEDGDPSASDWHAWIHRLKDYLNKRLYLGLSSFESHFTVYESGDFYKRHLDVLKGARNRLVSLVTYLNDGWLPEHGGELVLYPDAAEPVRVTPMLSTLVLFLSEEIPHEVLVSDRTRIGVAGWFRVDAPEDIVIGR